MEWVETSGGGGGGKVCDDGEGDGMDTVGGAEMVLVSSHEDDLHECRVTC